MGVYKTTTKIGETVKLVFQLNQHIRDEQLMRSLIEWFGCGNISKYEEASYYRVAKFSDICDKIIPFFNKYQIQGVKLQDYLDFCRAAELMKSKSHLTKDGLEKIQKIKSGINKQRPLNDNPSKIEDNWVLEPAFIINLHKKDVELLKLIQSYFGGAGRIGKERNGCCDFTVSSLAQILAVVIPHFDKYPLKSQKLADYLLFREVVMMMKRREHLTALGLQKSRGGLLLIGD